MKINFAIVKINKYAVIQINFAPMKVNFTDIQINLHLC